MSELLESIVGNLGFEPTDLQGVLIVGLSEFVVSRTVGDVFVLNGYAGTGKTSIISGLVKALRAKDIPMVLLAPTGRAAKVFSSYCGQQVQTIHNRMYRADSPDPSSAQYFIASNKDRGALFIVDEASMISDGASGGNLLEHLVRHVYSSPGCNLLLIGDVAQLPPVGQPNSPAMDEIRLKELRLNPYGFVLDEPVRQASYSGILYNATRIRRRMMKNPLPVPKLWANRFADVEVLTSEFLAERIGDSYSMVGQDDTIVITRSNKRANIYNNGIRAMVLDAEEELQRDERLVVAKNNYFWAKDIEAIDFIANGDIVRVSWIGRTEEVYGHRYADVELEYPGSDVGVSAKVLLDGLQSDMPSMSIEEMNRIYTQIMEETEGSLSAKLKAVQNDPYYNALQVKYAYCLTCHKAQGGQWKHVYIDMGALQPDVLNVDFYRWLYTAVTRASEKLYLINPSIEVE